MVLKNPILVPFKGRILVNKNWNKRRIAPLIFFLYALRIVFSIPFGLSLQNRKDDTQSIWEKN